MFFSLEDMNENALPNAVPMEFYNWVNSLKPVFMSFFFFVRVSFIYLTRARILTQCFFLRGI